MNIVGVVWQKLSRGTIHRIADLDERIIVHIGEGRSHCDATFTLPEERKVRPEGRSLSHEWACRLLILTPMSHAPDISPARHGWPKPFPPSFGRQQWKQKGYLHKPRDCRQLRRPGRDASPLPTTCRHPVNSNRTSV